jgi:hypothetical protein
MTVENGLIGWIAIIRAIRQHCGNWTAYLIEQRANQGSVALVRELGYQDVAAAVGIDSKVQAPPATARLASIFLMQPLARP